MITYLLKGFVVSLLILSSPAWAGRIELLYEECSKSSGRAMESATLAEVAAKHCRALLQEAEATKDKGRLLVGRFALASIYLLQGRQEEAFSLLSQISAAFRETPNFSFEGLVNAELKKTKLDSSWDILCLLLMMEHRLSDAERLARHALAIEEKELGNTHLDVGSRLLFLSSTVGAQDRHAEAASLLERALSIYEGKVGPDNAMTLQALTTLADQYSALGQFQDAEKMYRRILASRTRIYGPEHPLVAQSLSRLAYLYTGYMGRDGEAIPLYRQSLTILEKSLGLNSPELADGLSELAELLKSQGQYLEAESLLRRALAIREQLFGSAYAGAADSFSNLADLYQDEGKYLEAESLYRQALTKKEKEFGPNNFSVASVLNSLGRNLAHQGRYSEAETLFRRMSAINEMSSGNQSITFASSLVSLAQLYGDQGRYPEAEPLLSRSLNIVEKIGGSDHLITALHVWFLASNLDSQKRYDEAVPLYHRALAIQEKSNPNHPDVVNGLDYLAWHYQYRGDPDKALPFSRRVTNILKDRIVKTNSSASVTFVKNKGDDQIFARHAALLHTTIERNPVSAQALRAEVFDVFQLARSSATGEVLAQTAIRFAADTPTLATKIRARQDATARWKHFDKQQIELFGKPAEQRHQQAEKELRERIATTESEIRRLDEELGHDFPAYIELTSPKPIPLADAQKLLDPDEALLAWLVMEKESLLVMVRTDRIEVVKLDVGRDRLDKLVRSLRNATEFSYSGDVEPFPYATAHELYQLLLGPIEKQLAGVKHLILVPDGPLQSLSFGLLKVGGGETAVDKPREIPWLSRQYALTTLPAITSLRALRKFAKVPGQREPFVGFGDPTLSGDKAEKRNLNVARLFSKGPVADARAVADMQSLPETADELRSIAHALKAGPDSIYLREAATETQVKKLPLNRYRVVAFATHGLVAGEFRGVQEPSLVLTPPAVGTDLDDGLLTASEVAGLKLDADWVILSACNTAAPDGTLGAGGFTGLTKAFFYAGARAVLVSHWSVDSQSAMTLTTRMFAETEKGATKAEALRRAMMALADEPETAHPAYWAPFVVVGEGAR